MPTLQNVPIALDNRSTSEHHVVMPTKLPGRARAGRLGGKATLKNQGRDFFVKIGKKGGLSRKKLPRRKTA